MLSKIELTPSKKELVVELLDKVISYHFTSSGGGPLGVKGAGLQKFCDLLNTVYSKSPAEGFSEAYLRQEFASKYKVCISYSSSPPLPHPVYSIYKRVRLRIAIAFLLIF